VQPTPPLWPTDLKVRFLGHPPSSELNNLERWRQKINDRESVQEVMGKMASYLSANGIEASV
jgi:hypothetical protein